ncbi:hypothetical protein G5I_04338 [Acromyrmex echinatior]|uniref:Uncharacterized protein n=1 Tax=Acromyrmex echinatior TaxID=103372 RepID=F4WFD1_ACREC|nr:hypothetical protein G5I_04338 [Acromyrmex echinatior]
MDRPDLSFITTVIIWQDNELVNNVIPFAGRVRVASGAPSGDNSNVAVGGQLSAGMQSLLGVASSDYRSAASFSAQRSDEYERFQVESCRAPRNSVSCNRLIENATFITAWITRSEWSKPFDAKSTCFEVYVSNTYIVEFSALCRAPFATTSANANQISGILLISACPCHKSMVKYISTSRDDAKIIILDRSGRNYSVASWKIGGAVVVRLVVISSLVRLEMIVLKYYLEIYGLENDPEVYYRPGKNDEQKKTTLGEKETIHVCVCVSRDATAKGRLPDLTSDMCRLLSYRSLNGLVRNHRLDGDKDRKWRRDEEGRSSTVAVEVKIYKQSALKCSTTRNDGRHNGMFYLDYELKFVKLDETMKRERKANASVMTTLPLGRMSKGCVLDLASCSSAHVYVVLCKSHPKKRFTRIIDNPHMHLIGSPVYPFVYCLSNLILFYELVCAIEADSLPFDVSQGLKGSIISLQDLVQRPSRSFEDCNLEAEGQTNRKRGIEENVNIECCGAAYADEWKSIIANGEFE